MTSGIQTHNLVHNNAIMFPQYTMSNVKRYPYSLAIEGLIGINTHPIKRSLEKKCPYRVTNSTWGTSNTDCMFSTTLHGVPAGVTGFTHVGDAYLGVIIELLFSHQASPRR